VEIELTGEMFRGGGCMRKTSGFCPGEFAGCPVSRGKLFGEKRLGTVRGEMSESPFPMQDYDSIR